MTAEKPTVALVAHGIHEGGGMERALYELVQRGRDRYRFVVLASELDERIRPLVEWQRIAVPMRPIPLKIISFGLVAGLRLRGARADLVHTLGAIVPNQADVATVQFCAAGVLAATHRLAPAGGSRLRRANTALTRLIAIASERWCYRRSRVRRLAAVSSGVMGDLQRHYPDVDVTITPNGVDTERYRPDATARAAFRAEAGVDDDAFVALFVGGDWDHKGLEAALEGIADSGRPMRLWVVGRGDAARLAHKAAELGVDARFFGVRADTERFFQAADAFVLPTLYETFSLVAYEAAASGLPVVATRVHGIDELVGNDEAGILVERSAHAVGAALRRLSDDHRLRERLGAEGRRRAAAYGWDRSAASVIAVYDELLGRAA